MGNKIDYSTFYVGIHENKANSLRVSFYDVNDVYYHCYIDVYGCKTEDLSGVCSVLLDSMEWVEAPEDVPEIAKSVITSDLGYKCKVYSCIAPELLEVAIDDDSNKNIFVYYNGVELFYEVKILNLFSNEKMNRTDGKTYYDDLKALYNVIEQTIVRAEKVDDIEKLIRAAVLSLGYKCRISKR